MEILTQAGQWPDRVADVQSAIAKEQAHQGEATAWHWGLATETVPSPSPHRPG